VYGGLGVGELRRVKLLEDENRKMKQLVADLRLDKCIRQDVLAKRALTPGRRLRALTVVDAFTREALAIDVDQGIKCKQVGAAVARIASVRGVPKTIRVDNGPKFISKALDRWAYENGVTLDFSRLGKPTDNAFVESFNGWLRDKCPNSHWFL
jgi:putative transposase